MAQENVVLQPIFTTSKILLYGNETVGKTSLLQRFANDTFTFQYDPTIGIDFKAREMTLPNKENIKLQIWDTAGHEMYRNISQTYIRGSDVVCILYDITNSNSFKNIKELMTPDVQNPDIIKYVVGTKSDMEDQRKVTFDEGKKFADEHGYEFSEVSAYKGHGVNDLFLSIAKAAYKKKHPESVFGWSSSATSFFKRK